MASEKKDRSAVFWILFIGIFAIIPLVKTTDYQLTLANQVMLWGLFAVSFNMLFGVTGMLSFGQALYYGLGAYAVGMCVKYFGAVWFLPGLAGGVVLSVLLSFLLGQLTIRVSGVFFTMLTLAFAQLGWQVMFKLYNLTGGDDGIQGIIPPAPLDNHVVYYYFALALTIFALWFLRRMVHSPLGLILRCVRQNPDRVRFLGRRVRRNQLRVYMISSVFTALAGGLMAGVDGSIHTDMFYWTTSGHVILMAILGGIGQFFGPFIGAAVIIVIENVVGAFTEYWSLIIGLIMLTMVIAFPKGLVGEFERLRVKVFRRADDPEPALARREG